MMDYEKKFSFTEVSMPNGESREDIWRWATRGKPTRQEIQHRLQRLLAQAMPSSMRRNLVQLLRDNFRGVLYSVRMGNRQAVVLRAPAMPERPTLITIRSWANIAMDIAQELHDLGPTRTEAEVEALFELVESADREVNDEDFERVVTDRFGKEVRSEIQYSVRA